MKKFVLISWLLTLSLFFTMTATASHCEHVYTIGAYDEVFSKGATVTKLGPVNASNLPPTIPATFLEEHGNYAGGEAFCTIEQACQTLKEKLAAGSLPNDEDWHIYLLEANWDKDVYEFRKNDFRIKHNVKVLKLVRRNCEDN